MEKLWFFLILAIICALFADKTDASIKSRKGDVPKMKYKYTVLFGILFGATMNVLWGTVFTNILGKSGIGVGIGLGVAFACCGCLLGYVIDKRNSDADE